MGDESGMIKIGPQVNTITAYDTSAWDEKGHTNIVQIFVSHSDSTLMSIQFQYVENGRLVLSQRYGYLGQCKFDVVRLNHPNEYITWISGLKDHARLRSITFGTNLGQYGPFGPLSTFSTEPFCFKLGQDQDRQFGGFYGTVGKNCGTLKSIGVYLNPNFTLPPPRNVKVERA